MRSSRVLNAGSAGKTKTKPIAMRNNREMAMRRTGLIPFATTRSCGWRAEADFRRFSLGGGGDFKEFARFESQHVREDVRGKLLNFGVEVADHSVVITARVLHCVLDLGKRSLQRREALDGAELRIGFGKREQAFQSAGKHVLRLRLVTGAGRSHGAIARVDNRFKRTLLVSRVAFDRFHEVRNQVVATLELHINV